MKTYEQPTAGAMRAAKQILEDVQSRLLGGGVSPDWVVDSLARQIDRDTGAPELLALVHRCHSAFQQSPLNKDDDWVQSRLATDLRAAIAKAKGPS